MNDATPKPEDANLENQEAKAPEAADQAADSAAEAAPETPSELLLLRSAALLEETRSC